MIIGNWFLCGLKPSALLKSQTVHSSHDYMSCRGALVMSMLCSGKIWMFTTNVDMCSNMHAISTQSRSLVSVEQKIHRYTSENKYIDCI